MNRIAQAWRTKLQFPTTCPICTKPIGKSFVVGSLLVPLIVERVKAGGYEIEQVALHAGCQEACTAEELAEIRPHQHSGPAGRNTGAGGHIRGAIDLARVRAIEIRLQEACLIKYTVGVYSPGGGTLVIGSLGLISRTDQCYRVTDPGHPSRGTFDFFASEVVEIWRTDDGEFEVTLNR